MYLSVVIDIPTRALEAPFTYRAALEGAPSSYIGYLCVVPFSGRHALGAVVDACADVDFTPEGTYEIQPIDELVGGPFFSRAAAQTATWIASYYGAPLSESLRLFLPPAGRFKVANTPNAGACAGYELVSGAPAPKAERYYRLTPQAPGASPYVAPPNAPRQHAVLEALAPGAWMAASMVEHIAPGSASALRRLTTLQVIECESRRIYRGTTFYGTQYQQPPALNPEQQTALNLIASQDAQPATVVLDGVTGSGKTEVYLQAIERVLKHDKNAIVLVPEIALTPQTVGRFQSRFHDHVAVWHSRLSDGERQDQWERIAQGQARVVVGARSALFTPVQNLGLIIIDEEHDSSYKQGSTPRYHAREVARQLGQLLSIPVVLGSATPSFEARYQVEQGAWLCVRLPHRATGAPLPQVHVIDLPAEFESGNRSMFSRALQTALKGVQERQEKAVLLLNRRGAASFLLCRECGFVPRCPDCSTSLTYHETTHQLRCHQCGRTQEVPARCPECQSPYLRQFNAGTQRLESSLKQLFPQLPVVRMDADTTSAKDGHQQVLERFTHLKSGVLIGTQMIAKGLDFPEVTLVGVVSADTGMNFPDYHAGERTFQLLEQVTGRAGRAQLPGQVIIQTYAPNHPAVQAVAHHDPALFYDQESKQRAELGYPPYASLVNIVISSEQQSHAQTYAEKLGVRLRAASVNWTVLGPAPCVIERVKRLWRYHLVIKAPRDDIFLGERLRESMKACGQPADIRVVIDRDPESLM